MKHVFISYSHDDNDFAELLRTELHNAGIKTWVAKDDIKAGEDWRQGIDDAIRSSFAVVVIISPESDESKYVTYEWAFAYGIEIAIVPILYKALPTDSKENIHPRLESLQFEDFTLRTNRPWGKLINRLKEIETDVISRQQNDPRVMQAIQALHNWKLSDQTEAARSLGRQRASIAVPALIETLLESEKHDEEELQVEVIRALGEIGDAIAIQPIIQSLSDSSTDVKLSAIIALRKIGDASVVETLTKLFDDPSCKVKIEAARSMIDLGTKSVQPALLEAFRGCLDVHCEEYDHESYEVDYENTYLQALFNALIKIADSDSTPILASILEETEHSSIQQKAVEILGHIDGLEAQISLFHSLLLSRNDTLVKAIWRAIRGRESTSEFASCVHKLSDDDAAIRAQAIEDINAMSGVLGLMAALTDENTNSQAFWAITRKIASVLRQEDFPYLQSVLDSPHQRIRALAAEVARMNDLADLCSGLKLLCDDESPFVAGLAVRAIGELGCSGVIGRLKVSLKDERKIYGNSPILVKHYAAIALGKLKNKGAIKPLIEIMEYQGEFDDEITSVQNEAYDLLSEVDDREVKPDLIEAIQTGNSELLDAISIALAGMVDESDFQALTELLGNEDPDAQTTAASLLARTGIREVVPHLISALNENPDLGWRFEYCVEESWQELVDETHLNLIIPLVENQDESVRRIGVNLLLRIENENSVSALQKFLDRPDQDPYLIAKTIKRLGSYENLDRIPNYMSHLTSEHKVVRAAMSEALLVVKDKAILSELISLLNNENTDVRAEIAELLGELGNETTIEELEVLLRDPEYEVCAAAVEAIAKLSDSNIVPRLVDLLATEDNDLNSSGIATGISRIAGEADVPILQDLLLHDSADMRLNAIMINLFMDNKAAVPKIIELIDDNDERIRRAVAWSLGWIGDDANAEELQKLLTDEDDSVRRLAVESIGRIVPNMFCAELENVLTKDTDPSVRAAAARVVSKYDSPTSVSLLIERLTDDENLSAKSDRRVCDVIAELLATSNDPDAIAALEDWKPNTDNVEDSAEQNQDSDND